MDEQIESWQHQITNLGPEIAKAEEDLAKAEAIVKKLKAQKELEATARGVKTVSAQQTYADSSEELYQARLKVGVCKGVLALKKNNVDGIKIGFEEWRTKMVNAREERKRYDTKL